MQLYITTPTATFTFTFTSYDSCSLVTMGLFCNLGGKGGGIGGGPGITTLVPFLCEGVSCRTKGAGAMCTALLPAELGFGRMSTAPEGAGAMCTALLPCALVCGSINTPPGVPCEGEGAMGLAPELRACGYRGAGAIFILLAKWREPTGAGAMFTAERRPLGGAGAIAGAICTFEVARPISISISVPLEPLGVARATCPGPLRVRNIGAISTCRLVRAGVGAIIMMGRGGAGASGAAIRIGGAKDAAGLGAAGVGRAIFAFCRSCTMIGCG